MVVVPPGDPGSIRSVAARLRVQKDAIGQVAARIYPEVSHMEYRTPHARRLEKAVLDLDRNATAMVVRLAEMANYLDTYAGRLEDFIELARLEEARRAQDGGPV